MPRTHTPFEELSVLFTPEGFTLDFPDPITDDALRACREAYDQDRFAFLYHLGFEAVPEGATPTYRYLCQLGARFVHSLTAQPALEITREQTEVLMTDEDSAYLLDAVPYGLGTESITDEWLRTIYRALTDVFRAEIAAYSGTVALYLAEKTESLRLPERIFFHLVENRKDESNPFAFLATYTTRDASDKVRHMPLSYALTELKGEIGRAHV